MSVKWHYSVPFIFILSWTMEAMQYCAELDNLGNIECGPRTKILIESAFMANGLFMNGDTCQIAGKACQLNTTNELASQCAMLSHCLPRVDTTDFCKSDNAKKGFLSVTYSCIPDSFFASWSSMSSYPENKAGYLMSDDFTKEDQTASCTASSRGKSWTINAHGINMIFRVKALQNDKMNLAFMPNHSSCSSGTKCESDYLAISAIAHDSTEKRLLLQGCPSSGTQKPLTASSPFAVIKNVKQVDFDFNTNLIDQTSKHGFVLEYFYFRCPFVAGLAGGGLVDYTFRITEETTSLVFMTLSCPYGRFLEPESRATNLSDSTKEYPCLDGTWGYHFVPKRCVTAKQWHDFQTVTSTQIPVTSSKVNLSMWTTIEQPQKSTGPETFIDKYWKLIIGLTAGFLVGLLCILVLMISCRSRLSRTYAMKKRAGALGDSRNCCIRWIYRESKRSESVLYPRSTMQSNQALSQKTMRTELGCEASYLSTPYSQLPYNRTASLMGGSVPLSQLQRHPSMHSNACSPECQWTLNSSRQCVAIVPPHDSLHTPQHPMTQSTHSNPVMFNNSTLRLADYGQVPAHPMQHSMSFRQPFRSPLVHTNPISRRQSNNSHFASPYFSVANSGRLPLGNQFVGDFGSCSMGMLGYLHQPPPQTQAPPQHQQVPMLQHTSSVQCLDQSELPRKKSAVTMREKLMDFVERSRRRSRPSVTANHAPAVAPLVQQHLANADSVPLLQYPDASMRFVDDDVTLVSTFSSKRPPIAANVDKSASSDKTTHCSNQNIAMNENEFYNYDAKCSNDEASLASAYLEPSKSLKLDAKPARSESNARNDEDTMGSSNSGSATSELAAGTATLKQDDHYTIYGGAEDVKVEQLTSSDQMEANDFYDPGQSMASESNYSVVQPTVSQEVYDEINQQAPQQTKEKDESKPTMKPPPRDSLPPIPSDA